MYNLDSNLQNYLYLWEIPLKSDLRGTERGTNDTRTRQEFGGIVAY